jgi:hypothetical protein
LVPSIIHKIYRKKILCFTGNHYFTTVKAIIGSENIRPVAEHEFSSVACLIRKSSTNSIEENIFCTATFISTVHLLSTAECVKSAEVLGFVVNAGSHDIKQSKVYNPLWWLTFERFIEIYKMPLQHHENDISMIRVNTFLNHK